MHGTLKNIESAELKARMLQALMEKYQPEGGYVPLASPIYVKDLKSVRVFGVSVDEITTKINLGQDKKPEQVKAVVRGLWQRGKGETWLQFRRSSHTLPKATLKNGSFSRTVFLSAFASLLRRKTSSLMLRSWTDSIGASIQVRKRCKRPSRKAMRGSGFVTKETR